MSTLEILTASRQGDADMLVSYSQITHALNSGSGTRLEIEILGESHTLPQGNCFLQDGYCLAIPKRKLIQAFLVAREVLFTHLRLCCVENVHRLRDASAIMLLMDPENLTAANCRKRIIQAQLERQENEASQVLEGELLWLDGYLTSHLYRHTKSPTLWGHRRWVIEQCLLRKIKLSFEQDLKRVILVAAERHPKNYYAWSHMRWLCTKIDTSLVARVSREVSEMEKFTSIVLHWCLRNPADTSGFSFLLYCLSKLGSVDLATSIFTETFNLAVLYKWTYESVWVFLRTLVTAGQVEAERVNFLRGLNDVSSAHPEAEKRLNKTRDWCIKYQPRTPS
ncbi:hypothetical protein K3495_g11039 [Podosphaera aphanis]|nr:hypothetical protein K3495_g11039 [Podosphaera aphanis]